MFLSQKIGILAYEFLLVSITLNISQTNITPHLAVTPFKINCPLIFIVFVQTEPVQNKQQ